MEGAPVLVRLISQIAARFSIVVSEKIAAQAVPFVGALGGAGVNYAFIASFSGSRARPFHRAPWLERTYGAEVVRGEYEMLAGTLGLQRGP